MGQIGTPYRLGYQSKNFRTGLTDVVAFVLKPNNSMAGPFPMVEGTSPFNGNYFADFFTSNADPEGEYVECIVSPTEGLKDTKKFGMYLSLSSDIAALTALITEMEADIATITSDIAEINAMLVTLTEIISSISTDLTELEAIVSTLQGLINSVISIIVPVAVRAVIPDSSITTKVLDDSAIKGIVCAPAIVGIVFDDNEIG